MHTNFVVYVVFHYLTITSCISVVIFKNGDYCYLCISFKKYFYPKLFQQIILDKEKEKEQTNGKFFKCYKYYRRQDKQR